MKERGHDHRASQAHVPESLVRTPVLARMVREFDVEPNIRRANVEEHSGWIICELVGDAGHIDAGRGVATHRGIGSTCSRRARKLSRDGADAPPGSALRVFGRDLPAAEETRRGS